LIFKYLITCKTKQNSNLNSNNKIENRKRKQKFEKEKERETYLALPGSPTATQYQHHLYNPAAAHVEAQEQSSPRPNTVSRASRIVRRE
jgi:hypothetical protein